jgi:polysaccharide export outer membrane protein
VSVEEYKTHRVSIVGAVARPGIYALRHDQMSLVALLMEAGGIVQEGAAVIRIVRAGPNLVSPVGTQGATLTGLPRTAALPVPQSAGWQTAGQGRLVTSLPAPAEDRMPVGAWPSATPGQEAAASVVLPVRGLNIPFADVTLAPGDRVIVERPALQCIAIVGLVNRPGNMPCPPDTHYTLIQAIAFAGGLDLIADPRYVSIYRLRPDGEVMSVTLELVNIKKQGQLTETLAVPVRPGDVVSVEHTPRTRTNVFFDRVFRISLGLYFSPEDFWNND